MNNKLKILSTFLVLSVSFFLYTFVFPVFKSDAASMAAVYFYLSRIEADLDGSTPGEEVEIVLAIDTATSFSSGGQIDIFFPLADDTEWCRTADALIATGVTASAADQASSNWDIDSALPDSGGGLSAACTQGNGTTTVDTITITGLGALTAGTTYGVKIESDVGIIGTSATTGHRSVTIEVSQGTDLDSKAFNVYILTTTDIVEVTATVSAAASITCSIGDNSVDIGTLYPGGSFATTTHTIGTSSAGAGYYWTAYGEGDGSTDAGLYNSAPYLIASTGSTTIDLTGGNSEGFGMTVSDPDAAGSAAVPANFATGTLGQFGALDRAPSGARLILYQPDEQSGSENATITYGARASSAASSGSYSEDVTFVCGGYY